MNKPRGPKKGVSLYTVRLYDSFDHYWIDCLKEVSYEEALAYWNKETKDGTKNTCYADHSYYDIFPANTVMMFT